MTRLAEASLEDNLVGSGQRVSTLHRTTEGEGGILRGAVLFGRRFAGSLSLTSGANLTGVLTDLTDKVEEVAVVVGRVGRATLISLREMIDRSMDALERGLAEVEVRFGGFGPALCHTSAMNYASRAPSRTSI